MSKLDEYTDYSIPRKTEFLAFFKELAFCNF